MQPKKSQISLLKIQNFRQYCLQQTTKTKLKKLMTAVSKIQTQIYGYFANKSKHRLIVKNIHKNMTIYLKSRLCFEILGFLNFRIRPFLIECRNEPQLLVSFGKAVESSNMCKVGTSQYIVESFPEVNCQARGSSLRQIQFKMREIQISQERRKLYLL